MADRYLEAAQQRIQEQLNSMTAEMVMLSTNEPIQEKKIEKANKGLTNGSVKHELKTAASQNGVRANSYDTLLSEIKSNLKKGSTPSQL